MPSLEPRPELTSLSLDAALQLDRIERAGTADLSVLKSFLACLRSPSWLQIDPERPDFHSNPIGADIFNLAVVRADDAPIERVSDLEAKVSALLSKLKTVASGEPTNDVAVLKSFCLGLHQALLNESSPFRYQDDWIARDQRFA
jgi:hypothetical protein